MYFVSSNCHDRDSYQKSITEICAIAVVKTAVLVHFSSCSKGVCMALFQMRCGTNRRCVIWGREVVEGPPKSGVFDKATIGHNPLPTYHKLARACDRTAAQNPLYIDRQILRVMHQHRCTQSAYIQRMRKAHEQSKAHTDPCPVQQNKKIIESRYTFRIAQPPKPTNPILIFRIKSRTLPFTPPCSCEFSPSCLSQACCFRAYRRYQRS